MLRSFLFLVLALLGCFSFQSQPPSKPQRIMAVTIDDLPFATGGQPTYGPVAGQATAAILKTLKTHRAPAVGFVNEGQLHRGNNIAGRTALLKAWVDAGMTLGNHTYSHPDFNTRTIEQFEAEIAKGDVVTRQLMKSRAPYQLYFRHPMTHTGDTREKKEAIEQFLAARGYRVTPHTIENSDFIFNVGYARAAVAEDEVQLQRIRNAYLDFTLAATEFAENVAPKIFGRDIPQTLLIHANQLNADALDEMLRRFEVRGYHFVTLDAAMADAAYQTKDMLVSRHGPSWLWRWSQSLGLKIDFSKDPEPPKWAMELYQTQQ